MDKFALDRLKNVMDEAYVAYLWFFLGVWFSA